MMFSKYWESESGNIAMIGALSMLTLVVMAGGTVDVSNIQKDKERARYVVDAASLAAASETKKARRFREGRLAADVLTDSNSASGNNGNITTSLRKLSTGNFEITSTMTGTTENVFLGIIGKPETEWTVSSTSYINLVEAEVFLVLDVSASMLDNNLLTPMKEAAKNFVTSLDPYSEDDAYITISIIPFAETVNLGAAADDLLHPSDGFEFSSDFVGCFRTGDNRSAGSLQAYPTGLQTRNNGTIVPRCPPMTSAALLNSSDQSEILSYIDNLGVAFGTGSNTGLLWADRMLKNSWRNSVTFERGSFRTITPDTKKYVLFLTDGRVVWTDPDQNGINGTQDEDDVPINNVNAAQSFTEECDSLKADPTINLFSIGYSQSGNIDPDLDAALQNCISENGKYYAAGAANVEEIFAAIQQQILDVYLVR